MTYLMATTNHRQDGRGLRAVNRLRSVAGGAPESDRTVASRRIDPGTSQRIVALVGRLLRPLRSATRAARPQRLTESGWSPAPTTRKDVAVAVFSTSIAFLALRGGRDEGTRRLRQYLGAPQSVRDAFDRELKAQIEAERDFDRYLDELLDDDPVPPRQPEGKLRSKPVEWDERWEKRSVWRKRHPRANAYDREQLLALDIREVWEKLTGETVPDRGRVSCPVPEHEDVKPSCQVYDDHWYCHVCDRGGSVIDLAAIVFDIEPKGVGFFRIRERLLEAA